jgi:hypothetical protein
VRMCVDEARRDDAASGVHRQIGVPVEVLPNVKNLVAFNNDTAIFQHAVLAILKSDNRARIDPYAISQDPFSHHHSYQARRRCGLDPIGHGKLR